MTNITYRPATQQDLPQIIAIYNQIISLHNVTADIYPVALIDRQAWFDDFDQVHQAIWVIETHGETIGWVSLRNFNERLAYQHTSEISVYLDQNARGHHLGSQTVKFVENEAMSRNIQNIVALVFSQNNASQALFQKQGYERWGHLPQIAQIDDEKLDLDYLGKHLM